MLCSATFFIFVYRFMRVYRWSILLLIVVGFVERSVAQQRSLGIAYYDVESLYDTIPSKFYDDGDYTPMGALRWDSERYNRCIQNVASVIDSMAIPIVALRGVESEQVVRDIVQACDNHYSYVHQTLDFSRGLDFALLYYGDWFVPQRVRRYGRALCVEGDVIGGDKLALIIHYRSRDLQYIVAQLREEDSHCRIIIAGGSWGVDFNKLGVEDKCLSAELSGMGTRLWRERWQMSDRIASDIKGRSECGVYIRPWMLSRSGHPLPTYFRGKYYGGYSFNLPVYVYFDEFFVD